MTWFLRLMGSPIHIVMDDEWTSRHRRLTFTLPADSALYGTFEFEANRLNQNSAGHFVASDLELSPDGLHLTFTGGVVRMVPENWQDAWVASAANDRAYSGNEITDHWLRFLVGYRGPRLHGQRGPGQTDKEIMEYLINLVHAYRYLMEVKTGKPVSLRKAATAVAYDAEVIECPSYLSLTPDNGVIPWPASWVRDGATPDTVEGIERLRKRADRDKPNRY